MRKIANAACLQMQFDPDLALCLVMRLVLSHHLLFPQSARFLHILRALEIDPNDVLIMHGWPSAGQASVADHIDTDKLSEYCEELCSDLQFLIEAAVRWDARPPLMRYGAQRPSGETVRNRVSSLMYHAIALLAGKIAGFKYRERVEQFPDSRTIEPPPGLRKAAPSGLSIVGVSAEFLKSTGKKDQEESWPSEILQDMGPSQIARPTKRRVGGDKRLPLFNFRAGLEIDEVLADNRKWELTYLRARSALFDREKAEKPHT
jgi:hypothetical protein